MKKKEYGGIVINCWDLFSRSREGSRLGTWGYVVNTNDWHDTLSLGCLVE